DRGGRRLGGHPRGLELGAGALEHQRPGLGSSPVGDREHQIAKRDPEVAADEGIEPAGLEHRAGQRGDGALAVGPGDQHGRQQLAALEPAGDRQQRQAQLAVDLGLGHQLAVTLAPRPRRDPGREQQQIEIGERRVGCQLGAEQARAVVELGRQPGHFGSTIVEPDLAAGRAQQQGRRHAALTAADDQRPTKASDRSQYLRRGHRIFRVASATRARAKLMIQNRTMTLGSAQPLSSKWWWIGAILNTRLPVSLKLATWTISETVSSTKIPPTISKVNSFFEATARNPSPAPSGSEPTSPMNT